MAQRPDVAPYQPSEADGGLGVTGPPQALLARPLARGHATLLLAADITPYHPSFQLPLCVSSAEVAARGTGPSRPS